MIFLFFTPRHGVDVYAREAQVREGEDMAGECLPRWERELIVSATTGVYRGALDSHQSVSLGALVLHFCMASRLGALCGTRQT